ncbi:MAG: terminase small subunit [Empedobacter falsenii]
MAKKKDLLNIQNTSGRNTDGTFADGNKFGSNPKYDNPEILENKVLEYFEWIQGEFEIHTKTITKTTGKGDSATTTTEVEPVKIWIRDPEQPSITGLAIFLGFESRQSLYDYIKKDPFSYSIKKALLKVENNYEKGLWLEKPTGVIFGLKNMGWVDRSEIKQDVKIDDQREVIDYSKLDTETLKKIRDAKIVSKNE